MTSITSRPFNGQIGSAEQNSDLTLASEKGLILNYGTGNIKLLCVSNQDKITIRDGTNTVDGNFTAGNILAFGNLDTLSNLGVAGTIAGINFPVFHALQMAGF